MTQLKINTQRHIDITAQDLPLQCPMPQMVKWDSHPRVFLPIDKTGTTACPYCGTRYTLASPLPKQQHKN